MAKITGLAHIGVPIADMQRSLAFYVDVMGFTLDDKCPMPGFELAFLSAGSCIIELICKPNNTERVDGKIDHICVEVDDIEGFCEKIKDKVTFDGPISENAKLCGGVKNVFFRGPDGERIELFMFLNR